MKFRVVGEVYFMGRVFPIDSEFECDRQDLAWLLHDILGRPDDDGLGAENVAEAWLTPLGEWPVVADVGSEPNPALGQPNSGVGAAAEPKEELGQYGGQPARAYEPNGLGLPGLAEAEPARPKPGEELTERGQLLAYLGRSDVPDAEKNLILAARFPTLFTNPSQSLPISSVSSPLQVHENSPAITNPLTDLDFTTDLTKLLSLPRPELCNPQGQVVISRVAKALNKSAGGGQWGYFQNLANDLQTHYDQLDRLDQQEAA